MKKIIVILLLCVILIFSGCIENGVDITECCDYSWAKPACRNIEECIHFNEVPIQNFSVANLVIEIFIEQSTFFVGQTISVRAELRNETGKDLRLWSVGVVENPHTFVENVFSIWLVSDSFVVTGPYIPDRHPPKENYFYFPADKVIKIHREFVVNEEGEFRVFASFNFNKALRCGARTSIGLMQKIYVVYAT